MKRKYGGQRCSHDIVSSSWTLGKNGEDRWRGAWRHPGRNHSSRRLREGSSGGDHSNPSSSNAFERTQRSSATVPALAALGADEGRRAWSVTKLDSSSASEAANDMLLSASSLSLPPNETRFLALAEGCWSGWEKRMGETSLCGESEARGIWAGVSSLSTGRWDPLPCCFLLTGPWKEENGRARVAESLSEKKERKAQRGENWLFEQVFPARTAITSVTLQYCVTP